MSEVDQIYQGIQQMGTNPEATNFISRVIEANPFSFLKAVSQINLMPNIDSKTMTNIATLISNILKPSSMRPLGFLAENIARFSPEEKGLVKQAIVRGLMHEDNTTRNNFAYCFSFLTKIEKEIAKANKIFDKGDVDECILGLINNQNNQFGSFAPIGAIMSLTHILEMGFISVRMRKFRQTSEIIMTVSMQVLMMNDFNPITIEFKIECAKCLAQAIKIGIVDDFLIREKQIEFLNAVLSNIVLVKHETLHRYICIVVTNFIIRFYHKMYNIQASMELILQATTPALAAVKGDNIDIDSIRPYAYDVIKMWLKVAKFENHLGKDSQNIITEISKIIDEYLFSFISIYPLEDSADENPSDTISYFASICLYEFAQVAFEVVLPQSSSVYDTNIHAENKQGIFTAFCAAQIISYIPDESISQKLCEIFLDLYNIIIGNDFVLANSAFAAVISIITNHKMILLDENYFKLVIQAFAHALSSNTPFFIRRGLLAFRTIVSLYNSREPNPNLCNYFSQIMDIFIKTTARPDLSTNFEIENDLYLQWGLYISKLPYTFDNSLILQFAETVYQQFAQACQTNHEGSFQIRHWLSYLVFGIAKKVGPNIRPFAARFIEVIIVSIEQSINVQGIEDMILAISAIIMHSDKIVAPYVSRILPIALHAQSTQSSSFIQTSSILLGDIFRCLKEDAFPFAQQVLEVLFNNLVSQNMNIESIAYLILAISEIIKINPTEIGQIMLPIREQYMNFLVNQIPFLYQYSKGNFNVTQNLFFYLLNNFTAIMTAYENDRVSHPNFSTKFIPCDFIINYMEPFVNIIEQGSKCGFFNDQVAIAFLHYVEKIIQVFGTTNRMNIKIHKPYFKHYWDYCLGNSVSMTTTQEARRVYSLYKNA